MRRSRGSSAGAFVFAALALLGCAVAGRQHGAPERPNIVVIVCDDLGYGDLACYGAPTIATPAIDRMAAEGLRFTQFYAAEPMCTPSRAGLLTGRLAIRSGMCGDVRRVIFPESEGGLPREELTLAEALRSAGYATACVGKWHLGHKPEHLPTANGFDTWLGVPYSNDMDMVGGWDAERLVAPEPEYWNVPLMRGTEIVERPVDQSTLTRRYTAEALDFVRANRARPFFLYLAHTMPHLPLFAAPEFAGKSRRGLYGDVVEELDWSTGQVLQLLRELDLDERTLVIFTSDNGPWLGYKEHVFGDQAGSAGPLRDGKGSTWEGGVRVPAIAWWPGRIAPGVSRELASLLDVFPTACALAGAPLPRDRAFDGRDLCPELLERRGTGRDEVFYYRGTQLMAARVGPWKAHFRTQPAFGGEPTLHEPPLLYELEHDPGEQFDLSAEHPEALARIAEAVARHQAGFAPAPSLLERKEPDA